MTISRQFIQIIEWNEKWQAEEILFITFYSLGWIKLNFIKTNIRNTSFLTYFIMQVSIFSKIDVCKIFRICLYLYNISLYLLFYFTYKKNLKGKKDIVKVLRDKIDIANCAKVKQRSLNSPKIRIEKCWQEDKKIKLTLRVLRTF